MRTPLLIALSLAFLLPLTAAAQDEENQKLYFNKPQDAGGCIGGDRCGGSSSRLRIGLERRPVAEIAFRAHDNIGRSREGVLRVRIDDEVIEPRLQIGADPEIYRLRVENIRGDEVIFEAATNDEIEIDRVQISYGGSGGGYGAVTLRCESQDGREKFCSADTSGGVRMIRQLSSRPCREGSTWGYDRRGVWVTDGCRAEFEIGGTPAGGGGSTGEQIIRCESTDKKRRLCPAEIRGSVTLQRRLSSAPCTRGETWDYDRNGIWVSKGCRAEFRLGSPSSGGGIQKLPPLQTAEPVTVRCESSGGRYKSCPADVGTRRVRLSKKLSDSACRENDDWGYNKDAVWVRNGCRAVFEIGY